MNNIEHFTVEIGNGERIDKVISTFHTEWSRTQVQQWIRDKRVQVNGKIEKANYKCRIGDKIDISIPDFYTRSGTIRCSTRTNGT